MYTSNTHLTGNKVEDYELTRNRDHSTTYGASLGGAIIKNKLFFFVNGEYQDNVQAGPSGIARSGANDEWSTNGIVHRPFENTTTVGDRTFVGMNNISQYLSEKMCIRDSKMVMKNTILKIWVDPGTSATTG